MKKTTSKWIVITSSLLFILTSCGTSKVTKRPPPKFPDQQVFNKAESSTKINTGKTSQHMIFSKESQLIEEYKIGLDDVLEVAVYGEQDLSKVQRVRPDGHISLPLIGDVKAYRRTPIGLRDDITKRLSKYVLRPKVTVLVVEYQSKKVIILGEVSAPGLLRLSANVPLLEGLSLAGGITVNADLRGAMLIRNNRILPIDFYSLFKEGDLRQNIILRHNDVIIIPDNAENKVYVLGSVKRPGILRITDKLSIIEAITAAGGIAAGKQKVIIIRGGIGNPQVFEVDIGKILEKHDLTENIFLARGDIVYVPRTALASINSVLAQVNTILSSVVLAQSAIIQYPATKSVIKEGRLPGSSTLGPAGNVITTEEPERP
ncbi:MAG: polysaccharide biosynthesis/export family protein [Promethearchaeota archaeon]|jgi:polysaccharide export outer membrane protein